MGHLRKRKLRNGKVAYLARYRGPNGRERSKQFDRRVDAERFLASAEVSRAEGSWVDPARGRVRLATWVAQWRESERHALRPTTLARDEIHLRTRVIPTFGEIPLARIEHQDVQEWVNELSTIYAPTTLYKCHQILRKVMTAAVKNRMIARNPCDGVQLPRVERQEMRFLAPGQISELADAIDPRYRSFVLVGAYGGLRLGEMTGLRWERVDLLRRCVDVAEISYEIGGKVYFPNEWPDHAQSAQERVWNSLGPGFDFRVMVSAVAVPTLVIHGDAVVLPAEGSREWAGAIPSARLITLPGVGHFPWVEAPQIFFETVDAFL